MLIVILQFLFLFIRIIGVFDVIFHTFNCRLLELIKIQTLYIGIKLGHPCLQDL